MTTVALEQIVVRPGEPDANRRHAASRASDALRSGADIVVFPELAIGGYLTDPLEADAVAEPLDGPSVEVFRSITSRTGGLVAYGFCERADGGLYNSVALVGPDGPVLHYRKLHLFDAEPDAFEPGNLGLPVVETDHGRIGICVCYDLRFVEVLRILSLRGADIVLAPAAWVAGFDRPLEGSSATRHVDSVLAQANLDQVAVVAVSQVSGASAGAPGTLGGSVACDAFGDVVAGPLSRAEAASAVAELDIDAIRSAQVRSERIRPRSDRRGDLYQLHCQGIAL